MGQGYTRQSAADIVAGEEIQAGPLNSEFNQIEDAFDATLGHSHDGTLGEGPLIDLTLSVTGILPEANGGTGLSAIDDLLAIEALAGTSGGLFKTAANTWALRDITGTAAEITVTNGSGAAGAPTLSLPTALTFTGKTITGGTITQMTSIGATSFEIGSGGASDTTLTRVSAGVAAIEGSNILLASGLGSITQAYDADLAALAGNSTDGFWAHTGAGTGAARTLTGTANQINISNGAGIAGNPVFTLSSTAIMPGTLEVTGATILPVTSDGTALGSITKMFSDLFLASGAVINFNSDVAINHAANFLSFTGASVGYYFDGIIGPTTYDAGSLGSVTNSWSDLFLASGGVINFNSGDVTITHSADRLNFGGAANGYFFDIAIQPSANDSAALGIASQSWSDLFLAAGGVINWNNGDVTITHSSNQLTFAGATIALFNGGTIIQLQDAAPTFTTSIDQTSTQTRVRNNAGEIRLLANSNSNSLGLTLSSVGLLTTDAGQIKFPATQNPSSDANTLDDYEEGGETAISQGSGITSGSGTITTASGTRAYTKIGRQVTVSWYFEISNVGTGTGPINLILPFTASSSGGMWTGAGRRDGTNDMLSVLALESATSASVYLYTGLTPITATAYSVTLTYFTA